MPKYAEFHAFREQNFTTEADGDILHREARVLAIRRIEESARTKADFEDEMYLSGKPSYDVVLRYADSIGQSDRNIRGIRETALKKIRKKRM